MPAAPLLPRLTEQPQACFLGCVFPARKRKQLCTKQYSRPSHVVPSQQRIQPTTRPRPADSVRLAPSLDRQDSNTTSQARDISTTPTGKHNTSFLPDATHIQPPLRGTSSIRACFPPRLHMHWQPQGRHAARPAAVTWCAKHARRGFWCYQVVRAGRQAHPGAACDHLQQRAACLPVHEAG